MARTQAQLAERVLRTLGQIDAVESVSAEDDALIGEIYDDKIEELRDEGLVYWPSSAIPSVVFTALVKLIAYEADAFFEGQPMRPLPLSQQPGVAQLRRHISKRDTKEPVRAVYF